MKIKTITLQCTDNCGSNLQTMALAKFLNDAGYDTEIIDYRPLYLRTNENPLKHAVKSILFGRAVRMQAKKDQAFREKYFRLTKESYTSYEKLKQNPPEADFYITGSDQIWNPSYLCGRDPAYYLDFVPEQGRKAAYAASVGKSVVSEEEKQFISGYAADFDAITVREDVTRQWLQPLVPCPVEHVCDPVFLLDAEYYRQIEKQPRDLGKYILVYLVKPSPVLDALLAYLKKALNARVVLIHGVKKTCACDVHIRAVSADEFLGCIDSAAYVVTGSFHATVTSCILRKQFSVLLPPAHTARIEDVLSKGGISDRILTDSGKINNGLLEPIDFDSAWEKFGPFVNRSREILKSCCEAAEHAE